jgi:outer membrane protein assembly factor BamB
MNVSRDGFTVPWATVADGADLFVLDISGPHGAGGILEFAVPSGKLVRVVQGPSYQLGTPLGIATDGSDLFVASMGALFSGGALTEVNASTGALVRVISGREYEFGSPVGVAAYGADLFVADRSLAPGPIGLGTVTEVDAATGALVRVLSGPTFKFYYPNDVLADGSRVFVGDLGLPGGKTGGVTELDASTGKVLQILEGPVTHPIAMAMVGADLMVANNETGSVIEVP